MSDGTESQTAEQQQPPAAVAPVGAATLAEVIADTGLTRLTAESDPRSQPGKPLADKGSGSVLVRTPWQIDRFEHGMKGVPPITSLGVEVDGKHRAKLNELAAQVGLQLEEVQAEDAD
jgi:hypothetical protein